MTDTQAHTQKTEFPDIHELIREQLRKKILREITISEVHLIKGNFTMVVFEEEEVPVSNEIMLEVCKKGYRVTGINPQYKGKLCIGYKGMRIEKEIL